LCTFLAFRDNLIRSLKDVDYNVLVLRERTRLKEQ